MHDGFIEVTCFLFDNKAMRYIQKNVNPSGKRVGDCVIRAISTIMDTDWERTYTDLMLEGYALKDMPSANYVWGSYLTKQGYIRQVIPNSCPNCYTVKDFCRDHPNGRYILATGSHVIAVIDGAYIDTWDSGDEIPVYYWERLGNGI